jgi:hypothetical protein
MHEKSNINFLYPYHIHIHPSPILINTIFFYLKLNWTAICHTPHTTPLASLMLSSSKPFSSGTLSVDELNQRLHRVMIKRGKRDVNDNLVNLKKIRMRNGFVISKKRLVNPIRLPIRCVPCWTVSRNVWILFQPMSQLFMPNPVLFNGNNKVLASCYAEIKKMEMD